MYDLVALLGKFNRFKGFRRTSRMDDKGGPKDLIICYDCKNPGHKIDKCPPQQQMKFFKKKKAL